MFHIRKRLLAPPPRPPGSSDGLQEESSMVPFYDQLAPRLAAEVPPPRLQRAASRPAWSGFLMALLQALSSWAT
jgi:hypothetical protein